MRQKRGRFPFGESAFFLENPLNCEVLSMKNVTDVEKIEEEVQVQVDGEKLEQHEPAETDTDIINDNQDPQDETITTEQETDPDQSGLAPSPVQIEEPLSEAMSYMGLDSTAVIDIAFVDEKPDRNRNAVAKWFDKIENPTKGKELTKSKINKTGIKLVERLVANSNMQLNLAAKNNAERALFIGNICLKLKEINRGSKVPWGVWAEENLPFLDKRNRQKYMLLAKRADCHPFTYLGIDRMEVLCSMTKISNEEDPIGALLGKYDIGFDSTSEINMNEFKKAIDAAISNERLIKNGVQVNFNLINSIVNIGVDVDKSMIKRLKDVQECGGNPETLLENLALNRGMDDPEPSGEKRLKDFNTLSTRLGKTIDYIIQDVDQIENVDWETYELLIQKLRELQEAAGVEEAEAA
jgi:hypothetical protein